MCLRIQRYAWFNSGYMHCVSLRSVLVDSCQVGFFWALHTGAGPWRPSPQGHGSHNQALSLTCLDKHMRQVSCPKHNRHKHKNHKKQKNYHHHHHQHNHQQNHYHQQHHNHHQALGSRRLHTSGDRSTHVFVPHLNGRHGWCSSGTALRRRERRLRAWQRRVHHCANKGERFHPSVAVL